jgi:DNA polymerase-4
MAARLRRAGIADIASLWYADGPRLKRIWNGVTGLRFHALLHGADLTSPGSARRSVSHQHVLPPQERSMPKATPVFRQLVIRAAQRMRDKGMYCRRLSLDIKWTQHGGHYYDERSLQETQDTLLLLQVATDLWRRAPQDLRPLRIGVVLGGLVAEAKHKFDLFERQRPADLTQAIDRLNEKYGRGTVTFGGARPNMVSKIAFQRVPELKEF